MSTLLSTPRLRNACRSQRTRSKSHVASVCTRSRVPSCDEGHWTDASASESTWRDSVALSANPILPLAGAASIVVATVGLFVRASPTVSGLFLLVGAAMLVVSVFAPARMQAEHESEPEISLALLERSARAAESEIEKGGLYSLHDASGDGPSAPGSSRAFVANSAAKMLQRSDDETSGALMQELLALPVLEEASRIAPIEGVAAGYRSLTLPSGYMAVYRRLTPVEIRETTGSYTDENAYLIANLVPLVHTHGEQKARTDE